MLSEKPSYEETYAAFEWQVPEHFNIGEAVCDRWAESDPGRLAILDVSETGDIRGYSFRDLQGASNKFANLLSGLRVEGDVVGVLLPQRFETACAHIGALKAGAISLPLFTQFGPEALAHRLKDSRAKVVATNAEGIERLAGIRGLLPDLEVVFSVDGAAKGAEDFHMSLDQQSSEFKAVKSRADDPAILIYTSGTTGSPKGALHAHRVLLGHLPGVEMSHNFFPKPEDRIWTPADWAWIGGLLDVLLPGLYYGVPVVAHRFARFDPQGAVDLIREKDVTCVFFPPTALKMMRQELPDLRLPLRSVASGGETLGAELLSWGKAAFGTTINEFYGQTECNMIVSSCVALAPAEPGVMGFPVPGHRVAVIDVAGAELGVEEEGDIAVLAPNPVMFLGYLNNQAATEEKFREGPSGRWLITGDRGYVTRSGRIKFVGRDDDVLSVSGYRVGPGEIEDCLLRHPAVRMAGVVGRDDPLRGQVVVAFVELAPGFGASDTLADTLKAHVRSNLAPYETPREVRFVSALPLTTTGKIIRGALRDLMRTP